MSGSIDPPGLDLSRAAPYLAEASRALTGAPLTEPPTGLFTASVISGGKSNLTYLVRGDDGSRLVLRRPPLGLVLPSAHDMSREYRVIAALSAIGFPVPKPLRLCTDPDVIGAPFYLMEYVDGVVLRGTADQPAPAPEAAKACGERLLDLLLDLHGVDHRAVGLADFGQPEGYLERQVRRWHKQWERSRTRELPLVDEVTARLLKGLPASPRPGIVHGDYRLDNVMFDRDLARVVAVLDWEMATVGDPLADVGLLVVYTGLGRQGLVAPVPPGFPSGRELAERYAAASGVPIDRLDWYVALGEYKLAVISEGIHARYLQGKTVGTGFEAFGAQVPVLVERAAAALRGLEV
jgi:aminoglycoside phosphotransferase (APT) family kinase protein